MFDSSDHHRLFNCPLSLKTESNLQSILWLRCDDLAQLAAAATNREKNNHRWNHRPTDERRWAVHRGWSERVTLLFRWVPADGGTPRFETWTNVPPALCVQHIWTASWWGLLAQANFSLTGWLCNNKKPSGKLGRPRSVQKCRFGPS